MNPASINAACGPVSFQILPSIILAISAAKLSAVVRIAYPVPRSLSGNRSAARDFWRLITVPALHPERKKIVKARGAEELSKESKNDSPLCLRV
jgi:hypothetical protein